MNCKFCNRWGNDCPVAVCMGCGTPVCFGYGSGRAQCPVCLYGRLPGWSVNNKTCGYKGCEGEAVFLSVPRVKRCCKACATRPTVGKTKLMDYVNEMILERRLRFLRMDHPSAQMMIDHLRYVKNCRSVILFEEYEKHELYFVAKMAEVEFREALVSVYGERNAGNMRYTEEAANHPQIKDAAKAWLVAQNAWSRKQAETAAS